MQQPDLGPSLASAAAMATTGSVGALETALGRLGLKTPIPMFAAANVLNNPLDIARSYLADALLSLVEADPAKVYDSIQSSPNDTAAGDLCVKLPKFSPKDSDVEEFGFELMQKFPKKYPLFVLPVPEGALLRIFFNETLPRLLLPYIKDRKSEYGKNMSLGLRDPSSPSTGRQKVVVEFSSPNIVSDFHARHLRSTILGAHIANIYESMGWDVVRINYLGDWGLHIGLFGAGWSRFGSEEKLKQDPIGHVLEVRNEVDKLFKVELDLRKDKSHVRRDSAGAADMEAQGLFAERDAFFKRMEEKEGDAYSLWKQIREISVEHYTALYKRLNVSFDEYSGESVISAESMGEVEEMLKKRDLCEERDGSLVIDFSKHGMKSGLGTIRKHGSSTYFLRDLAAILSRLRTYNFDKMIYIVSADQEPHFKKLFKTINLLEDEFPGLSARLQHVQFNKVSNMSDTPLGDILDEAQQSMKTSLEEHPDEAVLLGSLEEVAEAMGITALIAQELIARRTNEHIFDIKKMTSFTPGTGPFLQYSYARLQAVLAESPDELDGMDLSNLCLEKGKDNSGPYTELLRMLVQYPEATAAAYKTLDQHQLMAYLKSMTTLLASCFECQEGARFTTDQKAMLEATKQVLENGMAVLGMKPLAR